MGHPVTLYTSHQLQVLLTSPKFVLNQIRKTGYEVILAAPELQSINLATEMVLPSEGTPHDCTKQTELFLKARSDMHNEPIDAQLTLLWLVVHVLKISDRTLFSPVSSDKSAACKLATG